MVIELLTAAWEKRRALLESFAGQTTAYRLFDAENDDIDGWVVERLGEVAIFQWYEGKCHLAADELRRAGQWCLENLGVRAVYLKRFVADRSHEVMESQLREPQPMVGESVAPVIEVLENGRKFPVRPYDGFSYGLFLDQRDNRQALSRLGAARVLNLFSYTCGFSVYCAGAETTSVDVSAKYLEWGKSTFVANGIGLERHRFFCADARVFLNTAAKRGEKYDLVIVDPPSFGRGAKGKAFSIKKDLEPLLGQVRAVLAPGGWVYVSTNFSQWSPREFDAIVQRGLGISGFQPLPDPPADFGGRPILCRLSLRA